MDFNSKKIERTSRFVNYFVSGILCLFLILLSSNILDDIDRLTLRPDYAAFENTEDFASIRKQMAAINLQRDSLVNQRDNISKAMEAARQNYNNQKESFDNWIRTRETIESPTKDKEVVNRAKKLDAMFKVEQEWRTEYNRLEEDIAVWQKQEQQLSNALSVEQEKASKAYERALDAYTLKVFLLRLLFVMPVLALGIFFFIRYRAHKYWPLFFGFTLFSIYAFFFGLVPYLPSYGGYVRYSVGILLSLFLGYHAINTIRKFLEQRKAELQQSTQDRAKKVQHEAAEKALEAHICPSCGKDFFLKKWEFPLTQTAAETIPKVSDFCRHCGLELFKPCEKCGNKNFAHYPFCSSCGHATAKKQETA